MKKFCNKLSKQQWRMSVPNLNSSIFRRSLSVSNEENTGSYNVENPIESSGNSGSYLTIDSENDTLNNSAISEAISETDNSDIEYEDAIHNLEVSEEEQNLYADIENSLGPQSLDEDKFVYDIPKISFSFFEADNYETVESKTTSTPKHKSEIKIVLASPPLIPEEIDVEDTVKSEDDISMAESKYEISSERKLEFELSRLSFDDLCLTNLMKSDSLPSLTLRDNLQEDFYKVPTKPYKRLSRSLYDINQAKLEKEENEEKTKTIIHNVILDKKPSLGQINDPEVKLDYCNTRSKLPIKARRATLLRRPQMRLKTPESWQNLRSKVSTMISSHSAAQRVGASQNDRVINLDEFYEKSRSKCKKLVKRFKKRGQENLDPNVETCSETSSQIVKNDAFFAKVDCGDNESGDTLVGNDSENGDKFLSLTDEKSVDFATLKSAFRRSRVMITEKKRVAKKKRRSSSNSSRASSAEPPAKKSKTDAKSKEHDADNNSKSNKEKDKKYENKKQYDQERNSKRPNDELRRQSPHLSKQRRSRSHTRENKTKQPKKYYHQSPLPKQNRRSRSRKSPERNQKSRYSSRSPKYAGNSRNRHVSKSRSLSNSRIRSSYSKSENKYNKTNKRNVSPSPKRQLKRRSVSPSPQNKSYTRDSPPVRKSRRSRSLSRQKVSPPKQKQSHSPPKYRSSKRSLTPSPRHKPQPKIKARSPTPKQRSPTPKKQKSVSRHRSSSRQKSPVYRKRSMSPKPRSNSQRKSPTPKYKSPSRSYQNNSTKTYDNYSRNRSPRDSSKTRKYSTSPKHYSPKATNHSYSPDRNSRARKYEDPKISEHARDKSVKNKADISNYNNKNVQTKSDRYDRKSPTLEKQNQKPKSRYSSTSRSRSRDRGSRDKKSIDPYKDSKKSYEYKKSSPVKSPSSKNSKHINPMPVVRLRSSSEEPESDNEHEHFDEEREKEIRTLKLLKSDLAAKAKESLEKKIPKKSPIHTFVKSPEKYDYFDIPTIKTNHSPPHKIDKEKIVAKTEIAPIKLLPLKKNLMSPEQKLERRDIKLDTVADDEFDIISKDSLKNEQKMILIDKTEVRKEARVKGEKTRRNSSSSRSRSRSDSREKSASKERKSRSSSRSSYSSTRRSRSGSSSDSSRSRSRSRTRSRSQSRSRSRSRSQSSSSSSSSSRSNSRSRSPSIPRRHGSPSFLDRRRITSQNKKDTRKRNRSRSRS